MDRVSYRKAIMVYKSLNGFTLPYMREMFRLVSDIDIRNTRYADKSKLYLPGGKILTVLQIVFHTQQPRYGIIFLRIFVTVKPFVLSNMLM